MKWRKYDIGKVFGKEQKNFCSKGVYSGIALERRKKALVHFALHGFFCDIDRLL